MILNIFITFATVVCPKRRAMASYRKILAFAIILYRLLKLRNFQDNTVGIRLQMPAHSVGASYPLYYRVS